MFIGSSHQFKRYDSYLINKRNIKIEELILEASKIVLKYVFHEERTIIFVGTGNNGADGLALSCLMKKNGQDVCVVLVGNPSKMKKGAQLYLANAMKLGVEVHSTINEKVLAKLVNATLVIDAIFGFGFKGELTGIENECVTLINEKYQGTVLAIDCPSGLNVDTGSVSNNAVKATLTITFVALKQGFLNPASKEYTGEVIVEDLKYGLAVLKEVSMAEYFTKEDAIKIIKERFYYEHKYNRGRILHLTGSQQYKGASILAAKGAVYTGAGLVCVSSEKTIFDSITTILPEVITIEEECINIPASINEYRATLIGCGLGEKARKREFVSEVVKHNKGTTIIDADAITALAKNIDVLLDKKGGVIITPHLGEFKRLVPEYEDSITAAIDFARRHNVIIVLKGPNTLITNGKETYRNSTGNAAMATAGMGDVLAGMISGFVGQGYSDMDACLLAVYLHGRAGDIVAEDTYTVLASHLVTLVPKIMKELVDLKKEK